MNEWMDKWTNGQMNKRTNERTNERINEWTTNGQKNEQMNGHSNKQTDEQMDEWTLPFLELLVRAKKWKWQGNLFNYSTPTIPIVQIFWSLKKNEYKYRIPLFGPYYSNSRIVWIIRPNTATCPFSRRNAPNPPHGHMTWRYYKEEPCFKPTNDYDNVSVLCFAVICFYLPANIDCFYHNLYVSLLPF